MACDVPNDAHEQDECWGDAARPEETSPNPGPHRREGTAQGCLASIAGERLLRGFCPLTWAARVAMASAEAGWTVTTPPPPPNCRGRRRKPAGHEGEAGSRSAPCEPTT